MVWPSFSPPLEAAGMGWCASWARNRAHQRRLGNPTSLVAFCLWPSTDQTAIDALDYLWGVGSIIMRDSDVREALRARLGAEHAGASDTRLVEEMGIWSGTVRIDVAVINGELSGYELKSDSDTLERLPAQADIYGKVFDRMTLVVGSKHAKKALKIIPKWWGCLEARVSDNRLVLKHKRKARINPGRDAKIIAQLLWKEEALAILDFHGLAGGWRSRRSAEILERLVERIPFASLTAHVRAALKARPSLGQRVACDLNMPIEASET
ncbi:hypothetical protein Hden_1568 [Hyphomicrobium denitrificans ATCC 51888]|uniref:Sce7726 family protein n=2 Tax=Hyphomicrobium denitrificans TaxID=53399 RepID=D8JQ54_HYPDA|nr:hypothetical protein Hden_0148 [Hyphomicrobium denitrificans ATCC 51888]ADJ23379.1 hypothetical protein Hden_1568 [Hyphomicrobium denitrificans ATCC 51888]